MRPTIKTLTQISQEYTAKADTMSEEVEKVSKGGRSRSLTRATRPRKGAAGKKKSTGAKASKKKSKSKKAKRK